MSGVGANSDLANLVTIWRGRPIWSGVGANSDLANLLPDTLR